MSRLPTLDIEMRPFPKGRPLEAFSGIPRWAMARLLVSAEDGAHIVMVYALEPGRCVHELHRHIADSMSAHGYVSSGHGHISHMGQSGTVYGYEAAWSHWRAQ
jgi:hypothetical protein